MRGDLAEFIPHVYRLAMRLTGNVHHAEDLTQETFLRAWERYAQLTAAQATRAWLFRIVINLHRDDARRRRIARVNIEGPIDQIQSEETPPDLCVEAKDELTQALTLMDSLPERQRLVLYLNAVEDLNLADICQILEINMSNAKANLSLARKRMRDELTKRESTRTDHVRFFDIT